MRRPRGSTRFLTGIGYRLEAVVHGHATSSLRPPSLSDVLVREGNPSPGGRWIRSWSASAGAPRRWGQTLVEEGTISEAQLAQALAAQFGLPYDQLTGFRVDSEFYHTISVKLMRRHRSSL